MPFKKGEVRLIRLSDIHINFRYCHPLARSRPTADRIKAHFNKDMLGMLLVSRREDRYWLIDGAARYQALQDLGYTHAECEVLELDSEEQERERYFYTPSSKRVTRADKEKIRAYLKSRKEGGDK